MTDTRTYAPTTTFTLVVTSAKNAAVRSALIRSKIASAKNLSADDRATIKSLIAGDTVPTVNLHRAIVGGLAVAITRKGQSMARRADREALLALYALLPAPDGALPVTTGDDTLADVTRRLDEERRQNNARLALINEKNRAIESLRHEVAALQESARHTSADDAAARFTSALLTDSQRQRVSDFRAGFAAGRQA